MLRESAFGARKLFSFLRTETKYVSGPKVCFAYTIILNLSYDLQFVKINGTIN